MAGKRRQRKPRTVTPKPKGHPVTTGSGLTPPIQYRVSVAQRAELEEEGHARGISADRAAKLRAFPEEPALPKTAGDP